MKSKMAQLSHLHSREHHLLLPFVVLCPEVADGAQLHRAPGRLAARRVHVGSEKLREKI